MTASLYRHFDADGLLLYVGISKNALARLDGHAGSSWYDQIKTVTIDAFNSRQEARVAEQEAITAERPVYNRINSIMPPRPPRAERKSAAKPPRVRADHPTKYEFAWGQIHALFASFTASEISQVEEWCA